MYYSPLVVFSTVVLGLAELDLSNSIPIDGLDSLPGLFDDNTSSSLLFNDDDELSTTTTMAATLSNLCAAVVAPDDLSSISDEPSLFSRRENNNGAECLPPVDIGAETFPLFETPVDTLENILPLKGQSDDEDMVSPRYPGLLPDGEQGIYNPGELRKAGWRPYRPMSVEFPQNEDDCKVLTRFRGSFPWELCCDGSFRQSVNPPLSDLYKQRLAQVDWWTKLFYEDEYAIFCTCKFMNQQKAVFGKVFPTEIHR